MSKKYDQSLKKGCSKASAAVIRVCGLRSRHLSKSSYAASLIAQQQLQQVQSHSLPSTCMDRKTSDCSQVLTVSSFSFSINIQQYGLCFWHILQRRCHRFEATGVCVWGLDGEADLLLRRFAGVDWSVSARLHCFTQHFTVGSLLARLRSSVQSILRLPPGLSALQWTSLPNLKAAFVAASVPHKVIICAKLVISSYALKNGYLPLSIERNMTPADQMSTAVDWWGYLSNTSGERNPGVPARGVFWWPLAIQMVQTSLGPCRKGHSTCSGLNEAFLDFEFSLEVLLKFVVALLAGTLKSLVWWVNCQLVEFTQRGFKTHSPVTLLAGCSLCSVWGDKRELRRLGWAVLLGEWWLPRLG